MQSTMVNIYEVGVSFDGTDKRFHFTGDMEFNGLGHPQLKIPPGIHAIVFTLIPDPSNTSVASFIENPVVWKDPETLLYSTSDESRCSLVVVSLESRICSHGFKMIVSYDDQLYESHDPTIINDPPVG